MRRRRRLVAVAGVGLAIAGCGGSSSGKAAPSVSPSPSSNGLTAARAQALAATAILRPSDLPGFTAKAQSHTAADAATENAGRACVGLGPAHYLARNFGTAFSKGPLEIDSSADVAASVAEADQELGALTGDKAPGCMKQVIGPALERQGLTPRSISVQDVPVTIHGADATFAFTYSIIATAQGQTVRLVGFEVAALVGQVEVDISAIGLAPLPVTLADTARLAATATSRVRAAT